MKINVINTSEDFAKLKDNWCDIYRNDKNATIFQSWHWLRGWIDAANADWFILAFKPENKSNYVAFFALYKDVISGKFGKRTIDSIGMAGAPLADYTGLVSFPDYEKHAIESFTNYLLNDTRWNKLRFREVADRRVEGIACRINSKRFIVRYRNDTPCPRLILPDSWEKYLSDILEPKFSKKFKSKINKAEKRGCYVTEANDENIELYLDYFIKLFEMRWNTLDNQARELLKSTFRWAYYGNFLRIHVVWYENDPAAIQVSFIDDKNKIYHYYNGGWDPQFSHLSPGIVLHGHCIKYAIDNGYKVYDFMRGDESYKYLFGAENMYNKNIIITPNTIETKLKKIKNRIVRYATTG